MANESDSFADNWEYLRTELRWLDQVLMLAVARQRKDNSEVERAAQSQADRATSHWWKGLMSFDGNVAYDEYRQVAPSGSSKVSYQQQLDSRIQASQRRGIMLALPALRDRLALTLFEKHLILMSLAPEMNRRYVRLYRYLQGDDMPIKTDLPTVDLILRLMCRNDSEWRTARNRLMSSSPLIQFGLLELLPSSAETLLCRPVKLAESLVNYLLAEHPTPRDLDVVLCSGSAGQTLLERTTPTTTWAELVLPESLIGTLRHLCQRVQGYTKVKTVWNLTPQTPGAIALLMGAAGTGKTTAARAIAHTLNVPLVQVDLAHIDPTQYLQLLQDIAGQAPTVLLIKSAHLWLGRTSRLPNATLQQFLAKRRSLPGITLFSSDQGAVPARWSQQVDQVLTLPLPDVEQRLRLWQQAFLPPTPIDPTIDIVQLAEQFPLTGGLIMAIAYEAALHAAAEGQSKIGIHHLIWALVEKNVALEVKAAEPPLWVVVPKKKTEQEA